MKHYDAKCPLCGTVNHNLYLEETDGWMECEHCGNEVKVLEYENMIKIPIFTGRQLTALLAPGQ